MRQFDAYIPPRWYDEGALVKRGEPSRWDDSQDVDQGEERTGQRTDDVNVFVAGAIAINSIVLGAPASDSLLDDYGTSGVDWPGAKYATHSPSGTNQSFADLFVQFRAGVHLINNDKLRGLAKAASSQRHKRPESWAKKLADDVKDADD